jgi:hypothetical protein
MSSVVISGDTSGAITLAAPAVSGTNTATLPAATGQIMVSGNMPAFSAYQNSGQTLSTGTYTSIQFQAKEFDTASAFNNTSSTVGTAPAYSFNPQVSGYYQISCAINWGTAISRGIVKVYKNGSSWKTVFDGQNSSSNVGAGSCLVYLNGTTDYVQIYGWQGSGGNITLNAISEGVYFQASMVRAA